MIGMPEQAVIVFSPVLVGMVDVYVVTWRASRPLIETSVYLPSTRTALQNRISDHTGCYSGR